MQLLGITEREYEEEMSTAIVHRIAFVNTVDDEAQALRQGQHGRPTPPPGFGSSGGSINQGRSVRGASTPA